MYCPSCRSEYIEGITECPDCRVELVEELPPKIKPPPRLILRPTTVAVMIAIAYLFALRMTGFFLIPLFRDPTVSTIIVFADLAAGLIMLLFFMAMYREYAPGRKPGLKLAAVFGMIGAAGDILKSFKHIHNVLTQSFGYSVIGLLPLIGILALISAVFYMLFFAWFYRGVDGGEQPGLKKMASFGLIASALLLLIQVFYDASYIYFDGIPRSYRQLRAPITITLLSMQAFAYTAYFFFFLEFYRELKKRFELRT